jgi:hypothetical protein
MALEPRRDQIETFVAAMFRHAGQDGYVSVRSFLSNNEVFRISTAQLSGGLQHLIDIAEDDARRAANNPAPAVFCPPIAVFNGAENWRARQADLFKGLVLSVECDEHPDAARNKLEEILGPATAVVRSGGQWIDPEDGLPQDKLHLHWRLAQPASAAVLDKLKQARKLATAVAGGDHSNIPTVHCLRWPGSWHRKASPRLCEIVSLNPNAEIDLDAAFTALKAVAPDVLTPANSQASAGNPTDWGDLVSNIIAGRNLHLSVAKLAAKYVRSGMAKGAAVNQLRGLMEQSTARQQRPQDWQTRYDDIPRAVDSAEQKFTKPEARPAAKPTTLDQVIATFKKWLVLRDDTAIYAVLGAVAANLLPGDPVWLGVIGPPSSAKTEILNSLLQLPHIEPTATLTPAALLSGTPQRQRDKGAKGGLLRKIGDFGILTLKDFGSILSMRPDSKAETLACLRELFDGAWTRHLGTDGGRTLSWSGKLGLIFGATEAYDDHYSVLTSLGDRFLLCRLHSSYGGQLKKAFDHTGTSTKLMRAELAAAVAGLFPANLPEPPELSDAEFERFDNVIALAVRLRAHVSRDRYSREIENIHGAEGPGRMGLALERLLAGLTVLGLDRKKAMRLIEDITLDSTPPIRRHAFETLTDTPTATRDIAKALKLPTTTTRRALEELAAHGLATRTRDTTVTGEEKKAGADLWALDPEWEDWPAKWRAAGEA